MIMLYIYVRKIQCYPCVHVYTCVYINIYIIYDYRINPNDICVDICPQ